MTVRAHNVVVLTAIILNLGMAIWSLQYWYVLATSPMNLRDYKTWLLVWWSLAPVFALIALLAKPASATARSN